MCTPCSSLFPVKLQYGVASNCTRTSDIASPRTILLHMATLLVIHTQIAACICLCMHSKRVRRPSQEHVDVLCIIHTHSTTFGMQHSLVADPGRGAKTFRPPPKSNPNFQLPRDGAGTASAASSCGHPGVCVCDASRTIATGTPISTSSCDGTSNARSGPWRANTCWRS